MIVNFILCGLVCKYICPLHLQIISKYYQKMNATLGHDQQLEFESDQNLITLDIPPEGITTSDTAWRITALEPPVVCSAVPLP